MGSPAQVVLVPVRRPIDDVEVAYLSLIVIAAVILNALLLSRLLTRSNQPTVRTSFSTGPYQMSSFSLFKLHLCIADFCILLIYALGKVLWLITYDWRLGDWGCKLYQFSSALSFYACSNIVVAIGLDRLKNVYSRRLQGGSSVRRVRFMLTVSWILAAICSLPQLIVWRTIEVGDNWYQCVSIFEYYQHANISTPQTEELALYYELGHQATVFWVPFLIIVVSYLMIVLKLVLHNSLRSRPNGVRPNWLFEENSRDETLKPEHRSSMISFLSATVEKSKEWRKSISSPVRRLSALRRASNIPIWRRHLHSRVFRCALAVVGTHIAMWLPYNCISTLRFINYDAYSSAMATGANFLEDLIVFNSLLNPMLYGSPPPVRRPQFNFL